MLSVHKQKVEEIPKLDTVQEKIAFGSYAMLNIVTTNTMKIRCDPDIAIKASNDYSGCNFMTILTGKMHSYN